MAKQPMPHQDPALQLQHRLQVLLAQTRQNQDALTSLHPPAIPADTLDAGQQHYARLFDALLAISDNLNSPQAPEKNRS